MKSKNSEITIKINEDWFMPHFEKIVKRYIRSEDKREMMLIDLRSLLIKANQPSK